METLVSEIREEFRIPPYYSDDAIERNISEGEFRLSRLNPDCDVDTDMAYRSLVKNYVYYAFCNVINEFFENFASDILEWQLESEVEDATQESE